MARPALVASNEIKIEKGVPMPSIGRARKYPFPDMQVGDSFAVAADDSLSVRSAASWWGTRHAGQKFAVRKLNGDFRCWRTA